MPNDDLTLLREYSRNQSEPAFAALVSRHVNLVYSVALRQVRDPYLAEEITQAVFIILARKADSLGEKTILPGWLCRTAGYVSARAVRTQIRRQQREQEAHMQTITHEPERDTWRHIAPLLDAAMARLGQKDHDSLVLRFFEGKNFAEVGAALGASEDNARMRVNRALEKLRKIFTKRGVALSGVALAGAISANSVQAAPVGLAKTISVVAITKGAAASASTLTLIKGALKIMAWTKMKTTAVAAVAVILAAGTTTVTIKEIQKHRAYSWEVPPPTSAALQNAEPQVRILPTKFSDAGGGAVGVDDQSLGISMPFKQLFLQAYGIDELRTVFPTGLPQGKYDYIANLRAGSGKALQLEIKRQFGLIGRFEPLPKDVLVLKVKDRSALRITPRKSYSEKAGMWTEGKLFRWGGQPSSQLANWLEGFFQIPVVDQTELKNLGDYNFDLDWDLMSRDSEKLKQALDKIGFELVSTNFPIDILVVEKAK